MFYIPLIKYFINENIYSLDSTIGKNTIVCRENGGSREIVIWVYGDKQEDIQETFQELYRLIQSKVLKQDIMISQKLVPNITPKEVS